MEKTFELDPLTKLAIRHGADKWGPHFYTPVYHGLFGHLRERPIRLLEIGVGGYEFRKVGGASLAMWADYFPAGRIVGIDIAEKELNLGPRVHIVRGSQSDERFLTQLATERGPFDIVIDDGSHVPEDVVKSFWTLFPTLVKSAFYVIEDIQTAFWPSFGGSPVDGGETIKLAHMILQALNYAEIRVAKPDWQPPPSASMIRSFRAYHNMFVVEKGDNSEPSNALYDGGNPHVAQAIASIEQELSETPTAKGYALLALVYGSSGEPRKALQIIEQALVRWPDSLRLLVIGARMAGPAGEPATQQDYIKRAIELDSTIAALCKQL